jgi:hypothetical protein
MHQGAIDGRGVSDIDPHMDIVGAAIISDAPGGKGCVVVNGVSKGVYDGGDVHLFSP